MTDELEWGKTLPFLHERTEPPVPSGSPGLRSLLSPIADAVPGIKATQGHPGKLFADN